MEHHHLSAAPPTSTPTLSAVLPLLVPLPSAARLLGLSTPGLRKFIRDGRVASVRLGRRVYVARATIDTVVARGIRE